MKCFICGDICLTVYITEYPLDPATKVVAVQKVCKWEACGWKSYPTKIPDPT